MGLHAYGIVPPDQAVPAELTGIDGEFVQLMESAGLGVLVTSHERAPGASIESIRSHNAVLQAVMSPAVTPVPIRFGQWFEDGAALVEGIGEDQGRWAALLARFAGRAEYGLTVTVPPSDAARDVQRAAGSTGTGYMQRLAQRQAEAAAHHQLAERIAEDITERLNGIDVEARLETPARGAVIARVAHLVAWADVDAYDGVMREVREFRRDVEMHRTGPWPPWSFT